MTTDAVARLEALITECGLPSDLRDLRAVLDRLKAAEEKLIKTEDTQRKYDCLLGEMLVNLAKQSELRERLEAAEEVVNKAERHLTKFWADEGQIHPEPLDALHDAVEKYRQRFGGQP